MYCKYGTKSHITHLHHFWTSWWINIVNFHHDIIVLYHHWLKIKKIQPTRVHTYIVSFRSGTFSKQNFVLFIHEYINLILDEWYGSCSLPENYVHPRIWSGSTLFALPVCLNTYPLSCWISQDIMPTSNFQQIRLLDSDCCYKFI